MTFNNVRWHLQLLEVSRCHLAKVVVKHSFTYCTIIMMMRTIPEALDSGLIAREEVKNGSVTKWSRDGNQSPNFHHSKHISSLENVLCNAHELSQVCRFVALLTMCLLLNYNGSHFIGSHLVCVLCAAYIFVFLVFFSVVALGASLYLKHLHLSDIHGRESIAK